MINKNSNNISFWSSLFVIALIAFIHGQTSIKPYEVKNDNKDYLSMIVNISVHSKISRSRTDKIDDVAIKDLKDPGNIDRAPLYPLLASLFINENQVKEKNFLCLKKQTDTECTNIIQSIQKFNLYLFVLLSISVFLLGFLISNLKVGILSGLIISLNTYYVTNILQINPEILASLLLISSTIFLFLSFKFFDRLIFFILSGLFLALLTLTKEVYFYIICLFPLIFFIFYKNKY